MTTTATETGPAPAYWAGRETGETLAGWVLRLQLLYRIAKITERT